jgi:GWxTD domain-containing protein
MQAPLDAWNPDQLLDVPETSDWLHDFANPARRYGLEQDHLQLFLPVWPPADGVAFTDPAAAGLRVQITSLDMQYAISDTAFFDHRGLAALAAGRPAALFYELDVNLLPEGACRLSIAPLGGRGRGVLSGFDVVWQLATLARHRQLLLGEGRTVFAGKEEATFLAATPAEQEKMLDEFWAKLNPDPESPINEAHLAFQYRVNYVRQFLGGFDQYGARDDRGEVYLALGPPQEVQIHHIPSNSRDQDDARIKVYQRFAPDRDSIEAKGSSSYRPRGDPYRSAGIIPMPYSHTAERGRMVRQVTAEHNFAFELWKYDSGGNPLFLNRFAEKGMGQRFLFVDRTGAGDFFLESSNIVQIDE